MERKLNKEERVILERICAACADRRDDGSCGLDAELQCSLERHLPQVLEAVKQVAGERIEPYVAALRDTVCTVCEQGEPEVCEVRTQVDCPLDRYFGLIVETIEDYRNEQESRPA